MAELLEPIKENETAAGALAVQSVVAPAAQSKWYRWRRDGTALIAYLLDSEVHTFAFSVAANSILSFIPFIVLLYTLSRSIFHSGAMVSVVNEMVHYFLPSNQDWVAANLAMVGDIVDDGTETEAAVVDTTVLPPS